MTRIKVLNPELYSTADLAPKTDGSAGLDLKLSRDPKGAMELAKEGKQWPYNDLVGTGLAVAIPPGHVGLLIPRSSTGHKRGLTLGNTIGVIDSDYRGEIFLSLASGRCADLKAGETVAQLVVVAIDSGWNVVEDLDATDRDIGGFGSTDYSYEEVGMSAPLYDEPSKGAIECPVCEWCGYSHELAGDDGLRCPKCLTPITIGEQTYE